MKALSARKTVRLRADVGVTHFMNKFRTLGLIDYNGEITVRAELLTDVVLHD